MYAYSEFWTLWEKVSLATILAIKSTSHLNIGCQSMWYPTEKGDEDIDCNEAEQSALPRSDTKHQSLKRQPSTEKNKNS